MNARRRAALIVCLLLAGCNLLTPGPGEAPLTLPFVDAPPGTGTAGPTPEGAPGVTPSPSGPAAGSPMTLRLWLPPQFTPDPNTAAGALLKARLDEFALLHPGIRITARVKGESGPGGMVSSLDAVAGAVPESLPDLVLMPRLELERAAGAGLLSPFETPLDDDWYDFARVLAAGEGGVYGLPFAGDALVLVYKPDLLPAPPRDWTTTVASAAPLLFPAGSAEAYLTLAFYDAAGGDLLDSAGRPFLDLPVLTALLEFYDEAAEAGVFTRTSLLFSDESAAYAAFSTGQAAMAVAWLSDALGGSAAGAQAEAEGGAASAVAPLPTVSAVPYTLVTGWMWALSNPDPVRLQLSAELAEFLTAPEFLADWTYAAGVLPPRASALADWPEGDPAALASWIVLAARPLPPLAVVEETGPALQAAVEAVLTGELSPAEAAGEAVDRVNQP